MRVSEEYRQELVLALAPTLVSMVGAGVDEEAFAEDVVSLADALIKEVSRGNS